jgi:hypothetical protein
MVQDSQPRSREGKRMRLLIAHQRNYTDAPGGPPSRSSGFPARALPSDSHQLGRPTVMSRDREGAGYRLFPVDETGFARKGALQAVRLTQSREDAKGNS